MPELSESQKRLIELDKKKPEIKKYYEDLADALEKACAEHGVGNYFQDEEGTVYKTFVPEGKFVQFPKFDVKRTRKPGEDASGANLSLKEAREQGFEVDSK